MANRPAAFSSVTPELLKQRTCEFAVLGIRLVRALPTDTAARVVGHQLLRAATSVGANYRATCRARSRREFVAKIGIVIEEADECMFWLEILESTELGPLNLRTTLQKEANELISIFVVTRHHARQRSASRRNASPS